MDSGRPVFLFIIFICFHLGHTLRCACKDDLKTCTSIHNLKSDFQTAQQICMESGGKLIPPSNKTIDSLLFTKSGHYWIGTERGCLKSRSENARGDSVNRERKGVLCSSRCMLVSGNRNVTERSCEEQADGFLCHGIQWENCWEDKRTEVQILNNDDCLLGPCEHQCKEVPGGHMCSCFSMFRPSRKNPERCEYYCDSDTCPRCPQCTCPVGYVQEETQCTDLDECTSNHNSCQQECRNTYGSYKCSCYEGFMLWNKSTCVPRINPTILTGMLVTPSVNYTSSHAAFATPAEYIGVTLFIILAIFALAGLLYYLQKSKSEKLVKGSDAPDIITQEAQIHQ